MWGFPLRYEQKRQCPVLQVRLIVNDNDLWSFEYESLDLHNWHCLACLGAASKAISSGQADYSSNLDNDLESSIDNGSLDRRRGHVSGLSKESSSLSSTTTAASRSNSTEPFQRRDIDSTDTINKSQISHDRIHHSNESSQVDQQTIESSSSGKDFCVEIQKMFEFKFLLI